MTRHVRMLALCLLLGSCNAQPREIVPTEKEETELKTMSLSGTLDFNLRLDQVLAALTETAGLSSLNERLNVAFATSYENGTDIGQINTYWHDRRTLTTLQAEVLDFYSGLIDPASGQSVSFDHVYVFYVRTEGNGLLQMDTESALTPAVTLPWVFFMPPDQKMSMREQIWLRAPINATATGGYPVTVDFRQLAFRNTGVDILTYDIVVAGQGTRS